MLDGAVLVISAVEGVQPQTRILMRALQRLGIPTLIFVNKIDRAAPVATACWRAFRSGSLRRSPRWDPGAAPALAGGLHGLGRGGA